MTASLLRYKQRLGTMLHYEDEVAFETDVVPGEGTDAVRSFAAELGPEPPQRVPLQPDPDFAMYGWPADGVRAKIERDGGGIRHGWRLREWPGVLLTAEPHAVWVDPDGTLLDITPGVADDGASVFVPAPSDAVLADDAPPPAPRYRVLYAAPDHTAAVAARLARMTKGQRAYEEQRARKAGTTLEAWLTAKHHPDLVGPRVAAFVAACEAYDANLSRLPGMLEAIPEIYTEQDAEADAAEEEAAESAAGPDQEAGEDEIESLEDGEAEAADQDDEFDETDDELDAADEEVDADDYGVDEEDEEDDSVASFPDAYWDVVDTITTWSGPRRRCREAIEQVMPEP